MILHYCRWYPSAPPSLVELLHPSSVGGTAPTFQSTWVVEELHIDSCQDLVLAGGQISSTGAVDDSSLLSLSLSVCTFNQSLVNLYATLHQLVGAAPPFMSWWSCSTLHQAGGPATLISLLCLRRVHIDSCQDSLLGGKLTGDCSMILHYCRWVTPVFPSLELVEAAPPFHALVELLQPSLELVELLHPSLHSWWRLLPPFIRAGGSCSNL